MRKFTLPVSCFAFAAFLAPLGASAMEPLEDEALAAVTGQDGVTIHFQTPESSPLTFNMYIEDTDGLGARDGANQQIIDVHENYEQFSQSAGEKFSQAGFVALQNIQLKAEAGTTINIDAGSSNGAGAGSGVLRVDVYVPELIINPDADSPLRIGLAGVGAASDSEVRDAVKGWERIDSRKSHIAEVLILDNIKITNVDFALELGPEAEQFLKVSEDADNFDYELNHYQFNDMAEEGGGALTVGKLSVENVNLAGTTASVTDLGLAFTFGSQSKELDLSLKDVGFAGSNSTFGDFAINGLDFSGATLTVLGK